MRHRNNGLRKIATARGASGRSVLEELPRYRFSLTTAAITRDSRACM